MPLNLTCKVELQNSYKILRLNMNSIAEIEQLLDVNLMHDRAFWDDLSITKIRGLVWGMLYKEIPRPSLSVVGDWMSNANMDEVMESIIKMWTSDLKAQAGDGTGEVATEQEDPTKG